MKYLAIIQARCGSSRLPGKVLKDLVGKTVIERVVERVKASKKIDDVIVATSIDHSNLPLIELCAKRGFRVFVGSELDVLDRYFQAAKLLLPKYVIRITADCPLIDCKYIDDLIELVDEKTNYACTDNTYFPVGLDAEVISFDVLKQIWKKARLSSEREHVTLYVKNHPEDYNIKKLICNFKGVAHKRLTLDHPEDYQLILEVYKHFASLNRADDFNTADVLEFLNENPELEQLNAHIDRFEGLKKSLKSDKQLELEF